MKYDRIKNGSWETNSTPTVSNTVDIPSQRSLLPCLAAAFFATTSRITEQTMIIRKERPVMRQLMTKEYKDNQVGSSCMGYQQVRANVVILYTITIGKLESAWEIIFPMTAGAYATRY